MYSAEDLKKAMELAFQNWVYDECVPTLKSCTPRDTGALQASIHAEKISNKEYWVGTHMYYGKFVENGRGPVVPVIKQALYWPELSHPVKRAKSAPAQHVVEQAIAKLQ